MVFALPKVYDAKDFLLVSQLYFMRLIALCLLASYCEGNPYEVSYISYNKVIVNDSEFIVLLVLGRL